ncbi:uncharacterized protein PHACADRAFT_86536 [Phanerochaete carnosa HHB-10118-sp]|uniref:Major facilitator superfamily (MFS) profile domain-containing protein n=1 Tax=Phanerochaete carnosa (strain HHB-10118-sp) TaxID=650164 RepID=K5X9R6_PHACS|nr:uncharacterized protein PHACADRAFT_86536 [Phanerochaete carnosa HHB-10118-sp]EKM59652.1 hypothetical protein PHACADRAFT_86536 [Phanerochaete carnosa HHB-10118-sp]
MTHSSTDTLSPQKDVEKADKAEDARQQPPVDVDQHKISPPIAPASDQDSYLVNLTPDEDPKTLSFARKVVIMIVICCGALCSTFASSIAAFAEPGEEQSFHVGKEVTILGVSLYVLGIAFGPLLVGPLSEVYGRSPIYRISYMLFWVFSWPVAFAQDIAVFLIFRFLTGFCSSAFLSVAGGSMSDIWAGHMVAVPTAIYTLSPFIGPMLGPLVSGFINQNTTWRWTYRIMLIWIFLEVLAIFALVPETYEPALRKRKAKKLRKATGDSQYYAPLDRRSGTLVNLIAVSCYRPFELLFMDRMVLLLDLWTSILFGILYLTFQAYPYIYIVNHGFDTQTTGLAFIGLGIGMVTGTTINVCLIRHTHKRYRDVSPPPEARLITGQVGAVVVPVSLYMLAFTSYPHVHWIAPTIATSLFGVGFILCFSSTFTYLVSAYRPMAASAMAANAFTRSLFAAAFPLFAGQMYTTLGTDGATALLAGIMTLAAPLPFIFGRIGAGLRARSRFAEHSQT